MNKIIYVVVGLVGTYKYNFIIMLHEKGEKYTLY